MGPLACRSAVSRRSSLSMAQGCAPATRLPGQSGDQYRSQCQPSPRQRWPPPRRCQPSQCRQGPADPLNNLQALIRLPTTAAVLTVTCPALQQRGIREGLGQGAAREGFSRFLHHPVVQGLNVAISTGGQITTLKQIPASPLCSSTRSWRCRKIWSSSSTT